MTLLYYTIPYLTEAIISYIYFGNKFQIKIKQKYIALPYLGAFIVQFAVNFLGIPNINLLAFILCNFIICIVFYDASIIQAILNSVILGVLMLITELVIFYLFRLFFSTDIFEHTTNNNVLIIQIICTKLLYFIIAYIISKISAKEQRNSFRISKSSLMYLLPVASILLLIGIAYITETTNVSNHVYILFSIAAVLLLFSNISVFWVLESLIKTQAINTELKLQNQKSEIDTVYYNILQKQYENSNILIHDIKRHLLSIKELSLENDCDRINKYIDNLYGEYQIKNYKKYSDNRLINAIINRYAIACNEHNIDFYCDIRDIDFSLISDNDITSILDNLIENAFESAQNAKKKTIELMIKPTNTNYITIGIWNTCSSIPRIINRKLYTTKKNQSIHGFGIKIIERISKRYDGNIDYNFDEEKMIFTFKIVLKVKDNMRTLFNSQTM